MTVIAGKKDQPSLPGLVGLSIETFGGRGGGSISRFDLPPSLREKWLRPVGERKEEDHRSLLFLRMDSVDVKEV